MLRIRRLYLGSQKCLSLKNRFMSLVFHMQAGILHLESYYKTEFNIDVTHFLIYAKIV